MRGPKPFATSVSVTSRPERGHRKDVEHRPAPVMTVTRWAGWRYRAAFDRVGGRLVLVGLCIEPEGEPQRLTTDVTRVRLRDFTADVAELDKAPILRDLIESRAPLSEYPVKHWREVARVYTAAEVAGKPPTVAVMHAYDISRPLAGKWVSVARNRHGLLPPYERKAKP